MKTRFLFVLIIGYAIALHAAPRKPELPVGFAQHAFDHLGSINDQANACSSCGFNVIYSTGFGALGYEGLPPDRDIQAQSITTRDYIDRARKEGIQLVIGYVCATSIVKLDTFDKNWPARFRQQFSSPPKDWLQVDINGKPLPSWYGGNYRPACMNNPDWQKYEKSIVRMQLDAGHDGIFFDNPTVHPQGCYCEFCMRKFQKYLTRDGIKLDIPQMSYLAFMHNLTKQYPEEFARFRTTIARDFLDEIQRFAQTVKPKALITCNNSLNTPTVFFAQARRHGYNIHEMSKTEDFVVVEDSISQPRTLANGKTVEYGYMYELLHAISHNKPVVAVTIVDGDYTTPPNLMRLAMAEAAAHNASYLAWPTWPEKERERMCVAVRPEANLLRQAAPLLNSAPRRADVVFYFPFEKWPTLSDMELINCVSIFEHQNIQFVAACEDNIDELLRAKRKPVVFALGTKNDPHLNEFRARGGVVFSNHEDKNWIGDLQKALSPSVIIDAPPSVRVVVRDQPKRTIVHLLNLNVQRISSFEDKVTPVSRISLKVQVPMRKVHTVQAMSVDTYVTPGNIDFSSQRDANGSQVSFEVQNLGVSTIVVIQ